MNRMLRLTALLCSLAMPALAVKPCPTQAAMMESLNRKLSGVPFQSVRQFFGGKPGHKWEALSIFAESEFSTDNTDFMSESTYYELKYPTLTADQKKQLAADLMTNYIDNKGAKSLNIGGPAMSATKQAYAAQTASNGVPARNLFEKAQADVRANISDTMARFTTEVQKKGLPQRDAKGNLTFDASYKNCTAK